MLLSVLRAYFHKGQHVFSNAHVSWDDHILLLEEAARKGIV